MLEPDVGKLASPVLRGRGDGNIALLPGRRSRSTFRRNGGLTGLGFQIGSHCMDFAEFIDAEISAEPMPLDRERIVLLRRRAAHHDGEMTWISKQRIRFAFGTMATPRRRRDFMPRPFPIHPLARCTSRRETFRPGKKEMC